MKKGVYLGAGTVMLLFLGLIYAWSIFKNPLTQIFKEWTLSQISLTFTISIVFFCLGGFFSGKLLKRWKPRYVVIIAGTLLFLGFFGVSMLKTEKSSESLILLYAFYGVLCGTGVGIGYNAIISTVNKWFFNRLGLASGVLMMGFGFGGIVLGSGINYLIGIIGLLPTFRMMGIGIFVVLFVGSFFMVEPKELAKEKVEESGYCPKEMLKTSAFWVFFLWSVLINSAGLLVINSAASIALAFGAPAVLGLMISVFNGIGRVIIGILFDRFKRKITIAIDVILLIFAGTALLTGSNTEGMMLVLVGILFTGMAYGGSPTISSAFVYSTFGQYHYPVNFSIVNFSLIPAAIVGPLVSSYLIEKAGGTYNTTFTLVIGLGIGGLILWAILNGQVKKI